MSEESSAEPETELPKRKSKVWIYVTILAVIGAYAAMLLPALAGQRLDPISGYSSMIWSAFLFVAIWRYRERSGWAGAGLGLVLGLFMFMFSAFVSGLMGA